MATSENSRASVTRQGSRVRRNIGGPSIGSILEFMVIVRVIFIVDSCCPRH